MSTTAAAEDVAAEQRRGARPRWFSDAIIAGFVAIGTSTGALLVAYVLANGAADSQGDIFRRWLYLLTHNEVVAFSSGRPAIAIALHVVLGLVWALVYGRFVEWNPALRWWIGDGSGASRGMRFALLPWIFSLLILLPAAAFNVLDWAFSAGPLVPLGNLVLHLIYGFTLGTLYDASADEPAIGEDLAYDEPLQRAAVEHSEDFGAAGILAGAVIGAIVGVMLAVVLPPTLPGVDFGGWEIALGVGGILAGGAVGGIVGSFAGLPQTPPDAPPELELDYDHFDHNVLPFLIPPFLLIVIGAIIVTFGTTLLEFGKSEAQIGPIEVAWAVLAAIAGIFVIGLGALFLATRPDHSPSSSRETVSHSAGH
jgi:hypothetical protein